MRVALILAALGMPGVAQGQECAPLVAFVEEGAIEPLLDQPPTCTMSKILGGDLSEDCHWRFPLRAEEAQTAFETLSTLLHQCADGPVTVEGATVNHPDSYDQITAQVSGRAVSLSLKDKGGLGQTLVFLRRERPVPNP